jgi:hypothetical protein
MERGVSGSQTVAAAKAGAAALFGGAGAPTRGGPGLRRGDVS